MLPRWSPCMSVCFSQTATLLKNILIVLCNNLSSGDGDLQTANCLGGGRELGPFRYLFSRSGSSYMPPRSPCVFPCCRGMWGKGHSARSWGMTWVLGPPGVWLPGSFPPLPQPRSQLADRRQYVRIDACQVFSCYDSRQLCFISQGINNKLRPRGEKYSENFG